jgi:hypothetical protein
MSVLPGAEEEDEVSFPDDEAGWSSNAFGRPVSVTAVLSVIDKSTLIPWALRTALGRVKRDLSSMRGTVTAEMLEDVLQRAEAEPDAVKQSAAKFGTRVHEIIDGLVRSGQASRDFSEEALAEQWRGDPKPVGNAVGSFLAWARSEQLEFDPAGDTLLSWEAMGVRGAFDCLAWTAPTEALLVDLKTSSRIHDDYAMQLAAYAHIFQASRLSAASLVAGLEVESPSLAEAHGYTVHPRWGSTLEVPPLPDHLVESLVRRGVLDASSLAPVEAALPGELALRVANRLRGAGVPEIRDEATARATLGMLLRPLSRLSCAVVRLGRTPASRAEVQSVCDMEMAWNGFKAALFLKRLVDSWGGSTGGTFRMLRPVV